MNVGKEIWMINSENYFWHGGSSEETFMFDTEEEALACIEYNKAGHPEGANLVKIVIVAVKHIVPGA